jgi:hypothetical protein
MKVSFLLMLVIAIASLSCESGPSISVSGTITIPAGFEAPESANVMVYVSVLDNQKRMQYRLASFKTRYDGKTSYDYVFPRIRVKDIANYDRLYISGGLDLNGNTGIEKEEPKGGTSVPIQEPFGPITGVTFGVQKY